MTETGQAITAAVWLAYTLLLAFKRVAQGQRKGDGRDAVEGQAGGLAVPPTASQRR